MSELTNVVTLKIPDGIEVSDGYHTFGELYLHRFELWIALCRVTMREGASYVWRSKVHSDGTSYPGWFVLGMGREDGKQITYHLPVGRWSECDFAPEVDPPKFDGHEAFEVLARLKAVR